MRKVMRCVVLILLVGFILLSGRHSQAGEFPLRKNYPDVPVISLEEVKAGYDNGSVILVDVRSRMEFDTIHPRKAVHIDLANRAFMASLKELVQKNVEIAKIAISTPVCLISC